MAVWSVVDGVVEKHSDRCPMLSAGIRIRFAVKDGVPVEDCAIYRKDPEKHPDTENILPKLAAKADRTAKRRR